MKLNIKQLINEEIKKFLHEVFNISREDADNLYKVLKFEDDYPSIFGYLGEKESKKLVVEVANNVRKGEGRLDSLFRKFYLPVNLYNEFEILVKNVQEVVKEYPHDPRLWSSPGGTTTVSGEFVLGNKPKYKGRFHNQEKEVKGNVEILVPRVNPESGNKVFSRMKVMKRLGAWVWNNNMREWEWKSASKPGVAGE